MRLLKGQRTYLKFALTYLIVVILMILLFIPIYRDSYQVVQENVTLNISSGISGGLLLFEEELFAIQTITQKITESRDYVIIHSFTKPLKSADYNSLSQANRYLKDLTLSLHFTSDVMVYFSNIDAIFTGKRIYQNDAELARFLGYRDMDDFRSLLFSQIYYKNFLPAQRFYSTESGEQIAISYAFTMPMMAGNVGHSVLVAAIPVAKILSRMGMDLLPESVLIEFKDEAGVLLYANHEQRPILASNTDTFEYNGDTYYPVSHTGDRMGFTIDIGIPASYYAHMLEPVRSTLYFYIALITFAGIAASLAFAYTNVRPLRRLIKSISIAPLEDQSQSEYRNDFQYIEQTMLSIWETNKQMRKKSIIDCMLTGSDYSQRDADEVLGTLPEKYRIAVVRGISLEDIDSHLNRHQVHAIMFAYGEGIVLIFDAKQAEIAPLRAQIQGMAHMFENAHIAVSMCYTRPDDVARAYKQACHVGRAMDKQKFIFADDIQESVFEIKKQDNQRIYSMLLAGDREGAIQAVYCQWYELSLMPYPDDRISTLYANQLGILSGAMIQAKIAIPLPNYDDEQSISQLAGKMSGAIEAFTSELEKSKHLQEEDQQNAIMQFIHKHCFDPSFSIAMLETAFSMSSKALLRHIKDLSGMSLADYVERIRLKEVERLLLETDQNIGDIAESCGFGSQNTLYKVFRRVNGVSPSAYRDSHSH